MNGWLYEQDLITQKYRILIASRHDRLLRLIASGLGIGVQQLRRSMIEHLDMILLENLPARYEAAVAAGRDAADPVADALGSSLFTTCIPLVEENVMEDILRVTRDRIDRGMPVPDAIAAGKALIREVITR